MLFRPGDRGADDPHDLDTMMWLAPGAGAGMVRALASTLARAFALGSGPRSDAAYPATSRHHALSCLGVLQQCVFRRRLARGSRASSRRRASSCRASFVASIFRTHSLRRHCGRLVLWCGYTSLPNIIPLARLTRSGRCCAAFVSPEMTGRLRIGGQRPAAGGTQQLHGGGLRAGASPCALSFSLNRLVFPAV